MIIGYALFGEDNDSFIFDPDDFRLPVCKSCGYVLDYDYISPTFTVNIKKYDVSYTYDGRCIVSSRFKQFCENEGYSRLSFQTLPNDTGFVKFNVENLLEVDIEKSSYNYENFCETCNRYESITPGVPVFLKNIDKPLFDGFYATNTLTGSCNGMTRIIIVSPDTKTKLKSKKMKGLTFIKIEI